MQGRWGWGWRVERTKRLVGWYKRVIFVLFEFRSFRSIGPLQDREGPNWTLPKAKTKMGEPPEKSSQRAESIYERVHYWPFAVASFPSHDSAVTNALPGVTWPDPWPPLPPTRYRRRLGSARRADSDGVPLALNRRLWLFLPSGQERQGWRRLATTLGCESVTRAQQRMTQELQQPEDEDFMFHAVQEELRDENRCVQAIFRTRTTPVA